MKDKKINEEHDFNISPLIDPAVFHEFQSINIKRSEEKTRETPVLKAVNVMKQFDNNIVIPNLNFTIEDIEGKSEIITMLGPSGCGKSTILNLIAGLIPPTSGELYTMGKKIEGPGMDRGMIFQKYSSFPFLNVIDNISYPLRQVKKMKKKDSYDKAKYWIDKMCLSGAEYKFPHQLSGGMQQRVAIARTLCMDARMILMDEPFGALDRKIRWEMQDLMAEIIFLKPIQEITVIFVTHDIPEAVFLGDRIWIIDKGNICEQKFIDRPEDPARIAQSKKKFLDIVSYFNEKIDNLEIKKEK
jgi:NitT/TauT family transport system ATP-binding protein